MRASPKLHFDLDQFGRNGIFEAESLGTVRNQFKLCFGLIKR